MKVFIFSLITIFLCCTAFSCSLEAGFDNERLTVLLPEIPADTKKTLRITRWKLVYPDERGKIHVLYAAAETNKITIFPAKNILTPVVCFPLLEEENGENPTVLKPAGAIYPVNAADIRNKTLRLGWKEGFSADFLLNILLRTKPSYAEAVRAFSYFNWQRFQTETFKSSNPWQLDCEKLFSALLNERVTMYSFTPAASEEKKLEFAPEFKWFHSVYIPEGFYAVENIGGSNEVTLRLTAGVNIFMTDSHIVRVSAEKTENRLAISAIRRYTDSDAE